MFFSDAGEERTRVEVVERLVLATQVLGCQDKSPAYLARLNSKVKDTFQRSPSGRPSGTTFGTAFAVRPDGVLLTAYHVVRDAKSIMITCPGGLSLSGSLNRTSASIDVAVLRVNHPTPSYLSLAGADSLRIGDPVFTIGFPVAGLLGKEPKFTDGSVSALSGLRGEATLIQMMVPVQPGNSGGPLVNNEGQVVGIVTSSVAVREFFKLTGTLPQNINWAVRSEYAAPLFERPASRRPVPNSRVEAIDRTVKATCMVEATR